MSNISPLRYPGGKSKLSGYIERLISCSPFCIESYVEPFAGGSAIALNLITSGKVKRVYLNDLDRAIYAFWYAILNNTEEMISRIETTEINTDNWMIQKDIFSKKDSAELLDLGFATLFLNRTNRSGILKANPIGDRKSTRLNSSH